MFIMPTLSVQPAQTNAIQLGPHLSQARIRTPGSALLIKWNMRVITQRIVAEMRLVKPLWMLKKPLRKQMPMVTSTIVSLSISNLSREELRNEVFTDNGFFSLLRQFQG